ncbi:MarR family winged helix-turn-helix transcriptional regulator [Paenibacillus sp. FSL K6-1230]|uniref:MarR family winged helix-turn-helix transcriptional regulator n=2 Tax=Paenibacillus TaxID=44249 RepID=UPI0030F7B487
MDSEYLQLIIFYIRIVLLQYCTKKGLSMTECNITDSQLKQFAIGLHEMNMIYEDYAKSVNLPYTSLQILNLITQIENCTQKNICEQTFLPKQTVNTVITNFYKKGMIELREIPNNRRAKTIHLTKSGEEFANSIIPQIREAERSAIAELTPEQREAFLEGMQLYCDTFRKIMKTGKSIN